MEIKEKIENKILNSATKIVLLVIITILCLVTLFVVGFNIQNESIVNQIVSLFSNIAIAVVSFYFGQKTDKEKI